MMAASIITKIVGAIFKIPLSNLIGADGMGVFSVAYTLYSTLFVISTAGLPVAISKMVAEANAKGDYGKIKGILRVSLMSFSIIGALASVIMVVFAHEFTILVKNSMAYYAVIAVAPSLFFVSIVSIIRGYFQGLSNMVPTAVSQVIESVGKLVFGLAIAYLLISNGYSFEIAAAGAIAGVSLGTLLSALYLIICNISSAVKLRNFKCSEEYSALFKTIVKTAVPITIGSAVLSITNLIDMFLVMNRLQSAAGFTELMANKLYGAYSLSVTLYLLPQTFIVAISVSIIPAITGYLAKNNIMRAEKTMASALRIAAAIALPAGVGFMTLSNEILTLLYYKRPDDVLIADPLLSYLGIAVIFVALVSITNSILQATGHINTPVVTMLIGGAVKVFANYVLIGIPSVNISGAPIATICCYGIISILNLILVKRLFSQISLSSIFAKPLMSALGMSVFAYFAINPLSGYFGAKIGLAITIILSAFIYFALLLASNGLPREDILMLPKGEFIVKCLKIR